MNPTMKLQNRSAFASVKMSQDETYIRERKFDEDHSLLNTRNTLSPSKLSPEGTELSQLTDYENQYFGDEFNIN